MLPKKLPSGSHNLGESYQLEDGSHVETQESLGGISVAQECTEASGWSRPSCGCKDFGCADCKRSLNLHRNKRAKNSSDGFVRVSLSKLPSIPSLDYKPSHFFVRAAGGMSFPVSKLPPRSNMSMENNQQHSSPPRVRSVPELDDGSLEISRYPGDEQPNSEKKSSSYLPLSVELVAGRGATSMPTDGNKSLAGTGSTKVKSVPPSRTLAISASLFKNYLIPSNDKPQAKNSATAQDSENSVKTKMLGIWNNVKYGWTVNLKTNFSRDSPVYLLANVYHKSFGEIDDEDRPSEAEIQENGMEAFKRHFYSLIWCTYRRQFPTLQNSTLTTDCGWGCMLRSGQMMVGQALIWHFLSSRWRHIKHISEGLEERIHQRIVQWLGDSPSPQCPLSLHNLVHLGNRLGKKAGDWYGPSSVAYIFKEAIEMGSKYIPDLQRVCVYVAQDCAVYIQDVLDLTTSRCVCNKGDLIKLSEQSCVKGKSTSEYLELIKNVSVSPSVSEASSQLQNGSSGGLNERGSSKSYASAKDASRRPLSRTNSETYSDQTRKTDMDSHTFASKRQSSEYIENLKSASDCVDSARGNTKNKDEPFEQCPKCDNWRSVIIMVPVRLGGESLNPIYASSVCSLFTHDLCIGIIGGRPKHSLYFVGFQEEHLIHLDPHLCQDAVLVTQSTFPVSSYHCSSPRKMSLLRMDPSATLGFYCHTRTDFLRLMEELPELLTPKEPGYEYPIFEFLDGRSEDADALARQLTDEDQIAAALPRDTPLLPQDSEEFVFI